MKTAQRKDENERNSIKLISVSKLMFVYKGIRRRNGAKLSKEGRSRGDCDEPGRLGGRSPSNRNPQEWLCRSEERFFRSIVYDAGAKNRYLADFAPGSEARAKSETFPHQRNERISFL